MRLVSAWMVVLALAGLAMTAGCRTERAAAPGDDPAREQAHAHGDHDHHHHHHHHDHGPHGGHLVELDDEHRYHAEWVHEDAANRVIVFILGADARTLEPIEAAEVVIETQVEGQASERHVLEAVHVEDGRASRFERVDPSLLAALSVDHGVEATLRVEIDGQEYSAALEHHHHHHHH